MARKKTIKTAILISGSGSNMEALIRSSQKAGHPARIDLVISNRPDVYGLTRAQNLGVQNMTLDHKDFQDRVGFEKALHAILSEASIELICCAGFMRVLTPWFVSRWEGRIINIHPSLLPKYKGLNTHKRALEAGDSEHGCSVHYVSEELDGGDVIAQARVPILPDDTVESLSKRVLAQEHPLYCHALEAVARKMVQA